MIKQSKHITNKGFHKVNLVLTNETFVAKNGIFTHKNSFPSHLTKIYDLNHLVGNGFLVFSHPQ